MMNLRNNAEVMFKRILVALFMVIGISFPAFGSALTGTIVNYDLNPNVVRTPARLACVLIKPATGASQWACVYASNRLNQAIQDAMLNAALWRKSVGIVYSVVDTDGFPVIRDFQILP